MSTPMNLRSPLATGQRSKAVRANIMLDAVFWDGVDVQGNTNTKQICFFSCYKLIQQGWSLINNHKHFISSFLNGC